MASAMEMESMFSATHAGILGPKPVELCHRRLLIFSVMATLALGVEVGYTRLVPKFPPLYAALIRAAVWDCVLVGVFVAQMLDLSSTRLLAGMDGGHYFPLAVLLYHALTMSFCAACDAFSRSGTARARSLHRSFVVRRVLLELAGGPTGGKLYLGRVCFLVSGVVMWLALRVIVLIGDGSSALTCFIILLFAAYCAAGLAATEVRHTLPGHLVQWLCTGWGAREALLSGPLKMLGGLLLIPFAASVIIAQIWLRTLAFLIWLGVGCPCCRLRRADNVYDAFERELAVPLLQCSFLAFAGAISTIVLGAHQMSSWQRSAVFIASGYYTGMLLLWTAPSVLSAKVSSEESFESSSSLLEDGQVRLLDSEHGQPLAEGGNIELEDVRSVCDELRALLLRERHDHSLEIAQLRSKLQDMERRLRAAERDRQKAVDSLALARGEVGAVERSEQTPEAKTGASPQAEKENDQQELPRVRWSIFRRPSSAAAASPREDAAASPSASTPPSTPTAPVPAVPPPPPPPPPPPRAAASPRAADEATATPTSEDMGDDTPTADEADDAQLADEAQDAVEDAPAADGAPAARYDDGSASPASSRNSGGASAGDAASAPTAGEEDAPAEEGEEEPLREP